MLHNFSLGFDTLSQVHVSSLKQSVARIFPSEGGVQKAQERKLWS